MWGVESALTPHGPPQATLPATCPPAVAAVGESSRVGGRADMAAHPALTLGASWASPGQLIRPGPTTLGARNTDTLWQSFRLTCRKKRSPGRERVTVASESLPRRQGHLGCQGHQARTENVEARCGVRGAQDSLGYLPEVFTGKADTACTACSPGAQPSHPHQPRVQLVAHSWAEPTSVRRQHLWAGGVKDQGVAVTGGGHGRHAPSPSPYNPAVAGAQVHSFSSTASQQRQHVLHLPHTRTDIRHLGREAGGVR